MTFMDFPALLRLVIIEYLQFTLFVTGNIILLIVIVVDKRFGFLVCAWFSFFDFTRALNFSSFLWNYLIIRLYFAIVTRFDSSCANCSNWQAGYYSAPLRCHNFFSLLHEPPNNPLIYFLFYTDSREFPLFFCVLIVLNHFYPLHRSREVLRLH